MKNTSGLVSLKIAVSALLSWGAAQSALAVFHTSEESFMAQMEPERYTHTGVVTPGFYSGPAGPEWFSYTVTTTPDGKTVDVLNFVSTAAYKVSGVGGYFRDATSIIFQFSDGSSFNTAVSADGFMGFTTDRPTTVWIESMSFSGSVPPELRDFTVGVDMVAVPEAKTWLVASLLGLPVLVNGARVWRKRKAA